MAGPGGCSCTRKSCACCKRHMEHLGGKMSCFLKRMTADSKHSMIMPNRFVNHFGGNISQTIKLESPRGILYVVEVTECMKKTVLQCGWEAFVYAHHIEENDSLLFRHIKDSHFEVLILDSDGCEKVFSCAGIGDSSRVQEKSADPVDVSDSSCDDTSQSSGNERFARCQRGGFSDRRNTGKLAAMPSSSEESEERSSGYDSPDYVLSRRRSLSEAQKEKVIAHIQKIQSEITVFVAVMRRCNVQSQAPYLVIPRNYAAIHFPHESAIVTLQRPGNSKKWHARFYKRKDNGMKMLRWLHFVHDNHVQEEDICLVIPEKGRRRFTFTVHLIQAGATHSRSETGARRIGSDHNRINTYMASQVHIEEPTDGEDVSSERNGRGVSHETLESDDSDGPSKPPYILPFKSRLSQLQKKLIKEKVRAIKSKVPIYVAAMGKTSVGGSGQCCTLELGSRYAAANLPGRNQAVSLKCNGKIWQTNMVVSRNCNRWYLRTGWRKFVRDNRLCIGDFCLFELKKEKQLTMEVHIISSRQR